MSSVSILLPTFNGSATIRRAIQCCQEQTHPDWHLVVVDNNSTDNTVEIVESIIQTDARIRLVKNSTNIGSLKNYRHATEFIDTDFFSFFADDDYIERNFLEVTLEGFRLFPKALMVCGRTRIENLETGVVHLQNVAWKSGYYEAGSEYQKTFNDHFTWTGILYRSQVISVCGKPGKGFDSEYFARVASAGDFLILEDQTAIWRIKGGGMTDSLDLTFRVTTLFSRCVRPLTYNISMNDKLWTLGLLLLQVMCWLSKKLRAVGSNGRFGIRR